MYLHAYLESITLSHFTTDIVITTTSTSLAWSGNHQWLMKNVCHFDFSGHTNILLLCGTKWQLKEDKVRGHQERRGVVVKKYCLSQLIGHCSTVFCRVSHTGPEQNGVIIEQGPKKWIGLLLVHTKTDIFWMEPNYCPKYTLLWEHEFRYLIYNPGILYLSPCLRPETVTLFMQHL